MDRSDITTYFLQTVNTEYLLQKAGRVGRPNQSKVFVTMSPLIALCQKCQAGGWCQCVGCTVPWMLSSRYSAPSRGQS